MLRKFYRLIGLCILCLMMVIGCQTFQNSPSPSVTKIIPDGNITIGTTMRSRTIDPADTYEIAGLNIIYNVAETLYTYQLGTTQLQPLLATALPQLSTDGLTYTIPLRQGVTFHDGTPFNAQAMAFSLKRFIENGGKPSFLLTDIVDTIQATQELEITIKLKNPFAAFPALLAFPGTAAVSPTSYKIGAGEFKPNELVGTGRYKLAEFSSNAVRLTRNESYWGDKPLNNRVDIQIYTGNAANLFNSFRTGAVEIAYQTLEPEQIKTLVEGAHQGQWQEVEAPGTVVNYMVLNSNQEPLNHKEVRQAIAALINRSVINERALQGQGESLYSMIPNVFDVYSPTFEQLYGDGNIEKAKQLLQQAGYSIDNPAKLQIWHSTGSNIRGMVAQILKALAKKNMDGLLTLEVQSVEFATASQNLKKGVYPTFLTNWYPDFLDADNYIQPFLECTEGSPEKGCMKGAAQTQGSFIYNQQLNKLINQQRQENNLEKRKEIFMEIQDILAEEVPYIPLWQSKDYAFAQNGITGVIINPSQNCAFWTIQDNI